MRACWMWRGCASSRRYSVTSLSERWRPNQVFHQNRNGIRTMSHPVTRNRMRLRVDMLARGLGDDSLEVVSAGFTDTTGKLYIIRLHPHRERGVARGSARPRIVRGAEFAGGSRRRSTRPSHGAHSEHACWDRSFQIEDRMKRSGSGRTVEGSSKL